MNKAGFILLVKLQRKIYDIFSNNLLAIGFSLLIYVIMNISFSFIVAFIASYIPIGSFPLTATAIDITIYIVVFLITIYLMNLNNSISFNRIVPGYALAALVFFFLCFLISSYISMVFYSFFDKIGIHGQNSIPSMPTDIYGITLYLLQFTILPSIMEEILFRKVMLSRLSKYSNSTKVIVSSLFFAVLHFSLPSLPSIFFIGIILSYLTLRYRSIFPSVVLHFIHNLSSLLLNRFGDSLSEETMIILSNWIIFLGMFSGVIILFFITLRPKQNLLRYLPSEDSINPEDKHTLSSIFKAPIVIIFIALSLIITLALEFLPRILS